MKLKKLLTLVLALALALAVVGCGNQPEVPAPAPTSDTAAADTSWEDMQAKGTLVVGLDATFAPMGFTDDNNEIIGFDIDLAKLVAEELGIEVTFQPIDWDAKEMELNSKNIDCIWNGFSSTPERQESMSLTKPYLDNVIGIMTLDGSEIKTKADLVGKNIATQAESAGLEAIEADDIYDEIKDNLTTYASYDEAVMDLEIGRVDAIIIDKVAGLYMSAQKGGKYVFADEDFGEDEYVIGFRKDDKALTAKIEEAIDTVIANGKAAEVSDKWFGEDLLVK